jgi:hypothetical protein
MGWDAIGAIGEIIGALAVVLSIAYLAVQVNTNTRAIRSEAGFAATHSWAEANEELLSLPDDQITNMTRAYGGSGWENFSEVERARMGLIMRVLIQKLEGQYFLFKYGNLDAGLWESRSSWAAGVIQTNFFHHWWDIEKKQRVYSTEFVAVLEATEPTTVSAEISGGDVEGVA